MPIVITDKAVALLVALSRELIEALPPVERRRLAAECRRVAAIAEPAVRPGSAAAEGICPNCGEPTAPGMPTCGDAACNAQEQRAAALLATPKGVLGALRARQSSQHE